MRSTPTGIESGYGRHWRLEDIRFDRADRAAAIRDPLLLKIVACASLLETGADLYTRNLRDFFSGDDEVACWLAERWEPEELQHGKALRAYVEHLWPGFDWQRRFDAFMAEYSLTCTVPQLEPSRALELAARCIVEMGTSTLYRGLHGYAREPVLKALSANIYTDEVRHYKMFLRFFRRYQRRERRSRIRVGRTLMRRLGALRSEDGRCAYRQVWDFAVEPNAADGTTFETSYRRFGVALGDVLREHAPSEMVTRMVITPLDLPASLVYAATRAGGTIYGLWFSTGT